jgi:hypothetical protein
MTNCLQKRDIWNGVMESTALLRRRLASRPATGAGLGLLGPVDEPADGCVVLVEEVRDGGHNSQPDRLA